jgi:erythrin-vacuolar iron transport family protein
MAFSEGPSDTGELTGRGRPVLRGAITGGGAIIAALSPALGIAARS